jgi:hypothetical protein
MPSIGKDGNVKQIVDYYFFEKCLFSKRRKNNTVNIRFSLNIYETKREQVFMFVLTARLDVVGLGIGSKLKRNIINVLQCYGQASKAFEFMQNLHGE